MVSMPAPAATSRRIRRAHHSAADVGHCCPAPPGASQRRLARTALVDAVDELRKHFSSDTIGAVGYDVSQLNQKILERP